MGRIVQRRLASLATASKLALGFAVVLALTLVVAATGYLALRDVAARSLLLERMSALNSQVMQMRSSEQSYALSADPQQIQHLHEQSEQISAASAALLASMPVGEQQGLAGLASGMTQYREGFDRYVSLGDNMLLSLEAATWLVVSAANSLDLLREGLADDGIYLLKSGQEQEGRTAIGQSGQLGQVHQLLLQALDQARVRLEQSRRSGEPVQSEIAEAQQAQALADSLREAMSDPGYAAVLVEVMGNIKSFNERLGGYTRDLQAQKDEYNNLVQQAEQMMAQVDQAYAAQQGALQAQLSSSAWLIGAATGLAILLGLFATLVITLVIVRPLKAVIGQAQRIAAGDLSAEIEVQRDDEIGQLLRAMQAMSSNLRNMLGHLQGGVTRISTAAQGLSLATEQTQAGVNGQKAETDQVAAAMHEMTVTVQGVARNAEVAAMATTQAEQRVGQGVGQVQATLQRIDQLAEAMGATTQSIERLSQDTQRIDSVLEVIKSVAEQTNLLALNAAIEAARAGEQGRGFAVVADEVRALARRTQQSTAEIESLIATLRAGTQRAVSDMRQSAGLVEHTVQDAQQTGLALTEIAGSVTQIVEMNQQIAAAAEQQGVAAEQVSRSISAIRDATEQSATAMDQSATASRELAELGHELQNMAAQFRV
ncbi:methyl-accepting chemotaxis protein [Pseudomonas cuatrocienegasensis]|uniref:Methyl-accepting chemotaxis protein n=3 Tax=Pseudomonas TaxID=286 RepID=A0ABY1B2R7_9PSED|nr:MULTISPECIES: methyl-accepting chemotaxis protein [Pseudomonas]OEC36293.1 chemotaxis protein [Pseudomonas sp. 21C1]SEP76866.1 methyl-accepting chemotaxis protein [Pseudomonas cuatrocienegasensis]